MSASRTSPQSVRPGSSRCPGFMPEKGHRARRLHHRAAAGASGAIEAARHVDGDDRLAQALIAATTSAAMPVQRPRQARPEQRIDDDVGVGKDGRGERLDRPAPALRHLRRVALRALRGLPAARAAPDSPSRAGAAPPRSRRRRCCPARRPPQSLRPRARPARRRRRPRRGRRSPSALSPARRAAPPAHRHGPSPPRSAIHGLPRDLLAARSALPVEGIMLCAEAAANALIWPRGSSSLNAVILGNSSILGHIPSLPPALVAL